MASSIPSQARAVDPFASYNSNTVNTLTRMVTYGEDGIATSKSCDVSLDATSNTQVVLQPGFVYKDDMWININAQHTVDFTDRDQYYMFDTGFDEPGYYYIVLEYTYAKSRPAPDAKALIVKPSQRGVYTPGGSWLFLKAVKVEGTGPFYVTSVYNFDPDNMDNRRLYVASYAGTETGLPTFLPERDRARIAYDSEADQFYFGYSDRWGLAGSGGASISGNTSGLSEGDLVFVTSTGVLDLARANLGNTTSDGVVAQVGVDGRVQTTGKVFNVPLESGQTPDVGSLLYLSTSEPGTVTPVRSSPFWQFVGRSVEIVDSTSVNMLYVRGEPAGVLNVDFMTFETTSLSSGGWTLDSGKYRQDINISNFKDDTAIVSIWDSTSGMKIQPDNIEYVNTSILRIWMPTQLDLEAIVFGPPIVTAFSSTVEKVRTTLAAGGSWIASGGRYYQDIDVSSLNLVSEGMFVLTTIDPPDEVITVADIEFDSTSNLRIWMSVNTEEVIVTAIGGSINVTSGSVLNITLPSGGAWILSGGSYYQDIDLLESGFSGGVVLDTIDSATLERIEVTNISGGDSPGVLRIWMSDNTHNVKVIIAG